MPLNDLFGLRIIANKNKEKRQSFALQTLYAEKAPTIGELLEKWPGIRTGFLYIYVIVRLVFHNHIIVSPSDYCCKKRHYLCEYLPSRLPLECLLWPLPIFFFRPNLHVRPSHLQQQTSVWHDLLWHYWTVIYLHSSKYTNKPFWCW